MINNIYLDTLAVYGQIQIILVNGDLVRTLINEEFTDFAFHEIISAIPADQIWIDNATEPQERPFFIDNALAMRNAMRAGKSYDEALSIGQKVEDRERHIAGLLKNDKFVQDGDYMKAVIHTLPAPPGMYADLVDGDYIRDHLDPYFVEGGNAAKYKWMPKNTVCVEQAITPEERPFILLHEVTEMNLMYKGMSYNDAHRRASEIEYKARINNLHI